MNANRCAHYHTDCFQAMGAHCKLLSSQIDRPDCPFYKTDSEVEKGRKDAHQHLVNNGLFDLIEKYEHNPNRTW